MSYFLENHKQFSKATQLVGVPVFCSGDEFHERSKMIFAGFLSLSLSIDLIGFELLGALLC